MKVLHLASFDRWSGAAAPAFAEVAALREAGIEAHYGYVGGYKLEAKLRSLEFAHPLIGRGHDPLSLLRSVRGIRRFVKENAIGIVHTHLSRDHWLGSLAIEGLRGLRLVRTLHSWRALRGDPFSRRLLSRTDAICVVNPALAEHALIRGRPTTLTPPPIDRNQFHRSSSNLRSFYEISRGDHVLGYIGKMSPGRGFEEAIDTLSIVRTELPEARLLLIGDGPHRPFIQRHAESRGVRDAVIFAGYHEADLADHLRTANVMLFVAKGSDEGHRAILESMACGVPVVCWPIGGVEPLLPGTDPPLLSPEMTPESLAFTAIGVLRGPREALATTVDRASAEFDYRAASQRLLGLYESL